MFRRLLALAVLLTAGAACAQTAPAPQGAAPQGAAGDHPVPPIVDPGRPSDRDGLSARGGPNPIGAGRSFGEYIGTSIYSPIGTAVNAPRIAPR